MNIKILDAATLGDDLDLTSINSFGDVTIYQSSSKDELFRHAEEADVLILNKVEIRKPDFPKLPNLKLICLTATGYNNIDIDAAREANVRVCNVAGYSTESVAQHTFSMLLYMLQHMRFYDDYVREGRYEGSPVFTYIEESWHEIKGQKWGIIGYGNIGRRVASIANEFGADLCYYSTSGVKREENIPCVSLETMLKSCDIISIHAPLNDKTRDLIGEKEFTQVKKNLIILNLGRGGIINEQALADAIDNNFIQAACVDVTTTEPIVDTNPLVKIKNRDKLLLTPHIAWASIEARNKVIEEICKNINAFINGLDRNNIT